MTLFWNVSSQDPGWEVISKPIKSTHPSAQSFTLPVCALYASRKKPSNSFKHLVKWNQIHMMYFETKKCSSVPNLVFCLLWFFLTYVYFKLLSLFHCKRFTSTINQPIYQYCVMWTWKVNRNIKIYPFLRFESPCRSVINPAKSQWDAVQNKNKEYNIISLHWPKQSTEIFLSGRWGFCKHGLSF